MTALDVDSSYRPKQRQVDLMCDLFLKIWPRVKQLLSYYFKCRLLNGLCWYVMAYQVMEAAKKMFILASH